MIMTERGRRSHLPGQLRPLYSQRSYEQPRTTFPSWNGIWEMISLRTHNKPDQKKLVRQNRTLLKEFFDARYDIAVGNGDEKLKKFLEEHYSSDENSKEEKLIKELEPYTTYIRDSFPKPTPRK
jgi:hypothetical protein